MPWIWKSGADMVKIINSYDFLRWYYPNQVRSKLISSSQPVTQAPVSLFLYMIALMYRVVKQK